MAIDIESYLFGDLGVQGVTRFALTQDTICVAFTPFEGPRLVTIATFKEARLTYAEAIADDDDFELPWQVIGFDCYELVGGRWRFVLNCAVIAWCFESVWPVVERADAYVEGSRLVAEACAAASPLLAERYAAALAGATH